MSTPRIWEAINSGNLKLLTEILQERSHFDLYPEEETAQLLIDLRSASPKTEPLETSSAKASIRASVDADYDIPRWCMVCGGRTKEQCTC